MPGNVPNISDDTFNFIKAYAKVILQQGVPILDSDWNELQDIVRMAQIRQNIVTLGNCRLAPGSSSPTTGFILSGDGSNNNFYFTPGLACVEGVIVPSEHGVAEPSSNIWYDSDDNYLMEGAVTAIGSGTITDEHTVYELFMSVVGCRIRMTSGAELGTTFIISSRVDATTLQLAGGIGSIAPGDTYKMLPPPLTTPVSPRVDEVYLQVWFDDINAEEDTDLLNPSLGLEPSHRDKVRSVVRVAEGGATPVTPDPYSLGVRYMKIGFIERTASSVIQSWYCETAHNAANKAGLGSSDTISDYPQLLWRNLGFKSDSEVNNNTISIYQWGPALIVVRGVYIGNDGHIYMGTQPNVFFYADTYGRIRWIPSGTPGQDMGSYSDESTFTTINDMYSSGPNFKGGDAVDIHSRLRMEDGASIQLSDDAHIIGDSDAASGAMQLFASETGFEVQMLYTDDEFWWLIGTTYNRATGEFVSITPASASYMVRFINGAMRYMVHGYSATPWLIDDWSYNVAIDPSRVHAYDLDMTREMQNYVVDQERTFTRYMGFLMVRMEHSTQGRHVALYRTEDNDSYFELISGNSTYFDYQYGHTGTVNVYPSGTGSFLIQNKVTQAVDIGYGYVRLIDI